MLYCALLSNLHRILRRLLIQVKLLKHGDLVSTRNVLDIEKTLAAAGGDPAELADQTTIKTNTTKLH